MRYTIRASGLTLTADTETGPEPASVLLPFAAARLGQPWGLSPTGPWVEVSWAEPAALAAALALDFPGAEAVDEQGRVITLPPPPPVPPGAVA